ncbi:ataxin-2 [Cricetulus griseus]|uniref:Ataxin-2 n=1 Tax=Cricetulus griseus TaxID=10029 RepID=A0A061I5L6_CRIGR|nr:ataxin-2 [Cricetulus griseus]
MDALELVLQIVVSHLMWVWEELGRNSSKGLPQPTISFDGIYANVRMVHILTSVVGSKCEVQVKNGGVYEGVFKTYSPKCDLVLDAAHEKSTESSSGPKREEIMESILFKCSDFVVVQFKDTDSSYARRGVCQCVHLSASAHKVQKGVTDLLELELQSNGWDPNDMFRYNEENYGVVSTYDSSLSSYTVPLERDNSEEFLKREARANQLAEEIESSAQYKARVALENDDRSEEEKYTAVQRNCSDREGHGTSSRESKYIPPGQRNREVISWGSGRQSSPRMGQPGPGSMPSRAASHTSDFNPNSGSDQRVVNGGNNSVLLLREKNRQPISGVEVFILSFISFVLSGVPWPSPCPSPSSRPPSRYQSGPNSLPPRAATPTRPPSRPPSRPSRPPSHPSAHGSPAPVSTVPKRMSSEGPPRMSPKAQRHPRNHRVSAGRGSMSSGLEFVSHNPPSEAAAPPVARTSPAGGTWSSVVSGVPRLSPKTHRPRSPRQNSIGNSPSGPVLASPQAGIIPTEAVSMPVPAASPTPASPASNRALTPSIEALRNRGRQISLQPSSTPESMDQLLSKNREGEKSRDLMKDKIEASAKDAFVDNSSSNCTSGSSKTNSPSISPSVLSNSEHKRGPEVTSQGVQTSSPACKQEKEDREEKKDAAEQVRKSTLNPNAKEFNPRSFSQCHLPVVIFTDAFTDSAVSAKVNGEHKERDLEPWDAGELTASEELEALENDVHPHVYSPVIQGNARMMAPPAHAQPGLVSSSATQFGAHEQTHAMYACPKLPYNKETSPSFYFAISTGSLAQQYAHPNATLHPHTPHPQPSATPTGQQQSQHGGNHPAPSPVQHHQHQAAQALHLASPQQQSAIYHAGLAPTPPSMTPASNTQSPQSSFPAAQQTVFTIHPSHVQPAYTTPPHMAHVPQAHVQSGMVPSHPTAHAPMMLMTTQPPGGPQAALAQSALQPIPVSTTAHFPYMTHPSVQAHHQQQL